MSETCNGWKNRQTWLTNLWMNESGDTDTYECRAREFKRNGTDRDESTRKLAHEMHVDYVHQVHDCSDSGMPPMLADILGHALACVDWHTIAGHIVDDVFNGVTQ